jgi:hypothetical protein
MRPSIYRTLELIGEHAPDLVATEGLRASTDLIGLRRVAAYAKHIPMGQLDEADQAAVREAQSMANDLRGRGRPRTGTAIQVRIPDTILAKLDEAADGNRAELIRTILEDWTRGV